MQHCLSRALCRKHISTGCNAKPHPGKLLRHGVSITDACIGWAQTAPLLQSLSQAVRERRG